MFLDRQALKNSLFGLVGFYQTSNPVYPLLTSSLLESRSGLYFNDVHSLLTIENIDQSVKNFNEFSYPMYSSSVTYSKGQKVTDGSQNWEYINDTPASGITPVEGVTWTAIDSLSDGLVRAVNNGIDRMIDAYMGAKKAKFRTRSIFDRVLLFNGIANYRALEPNNNKFVGLRIRFKKQEYGLVTILNRIGHQFSSNFTGLTLRLYHDSQQTAIATFTLDHAEGRSSQWTVTTTDNILTYDTYDAGGDFYLGYKQSDLEALGAQALNKEITWGEPICASCDSRWAGFYKQYSEYIEINGFEIAESELPGDTLFDPLDVDLTLNKTYGLNLDLTEKCDLSSFIIREEQVAAEAMKYHVGLVLLEQISSSTRGANQISNQVKKEAERQLFSMRDATGTVADRAISAIRSMEFDFSGMDNKCLPSDDNFELRVKRRTV